MPSHQFADARYGPSWGVHACPLSPCTVSRGSGRRTPCLLLAGAVCLLLFIARDSVVEASSEMKQKILKKMVKGAFKSTAKYPGWVIRNWYLGLARMMHGWLMAFSRRSTRRLTGAWFRAFVYNLSHGVAPLHSEDGGHAASADKPDHSGAEPVASHQEARVAFSQPVAVNYQAIRQMHELFEDAALTEADTSLASNFASIVEKATEADYRKLRPTVERVLYAGLTAAYEGQLFQSVGGQMSENFKTVVTGSGCPFSNYSSYNFVKKAMAGADPIKLVQETQVEQTPGGVPYTSYECQSFKNYMVDRLERDAVSFVDTVEKLASGVAGRSFYDMSALVQAEKLNAPGFGNEATRAERSDLGKIVTPPEEHLVSAVQFLIPQL
ncbi:hypothetical protein BESB_003700 [Besnoitia besnoiti]|uniref:Uncharacterized protein n=1 Tax=Besnoitia besnoiti TaxID=94643 RepID=A0A2A9MJE0_BESBE|nr:hypothetical protein BESB_003700 [Besnoitia besnoiti]PFH38029.1 hypothetical protein BESB_003700 [Besnoitia besnoiti]